MKNNPERLVKSVREGDMRALARVISLIEDETSVAKDCIELLFPHTGHAHVIGVTGAPGAGKSTIVDLLAMHIVKMDAKVAVLAIDPTSPFSGGALLGDRIRMSSSSAESNVWLRRES